MTELYLISPPVINDLAAFAEQFKSACDGGSVAVFQLRLKQPDATDQRHSTQTMTDDHIKRACDILLPLCHERNIAFMLNDTPHLVKETGADGVHVGQEDLERMSPSISEIRHMIGEDAAIGVSCYDSKDLAMMAGEQGADYVSFGAFFESPTKGNTKRPDPEILSWWTTHTVIPCVAIGGITPENCGTLLAHQPDFIAVISAVWNHKDGPAVAVKAFAAQLNHAY